MLFVAYEGWNKKVVIIESVEVEMKMGEVKTKKKGTCLPTKKRKRLHVNYGGFFTSIPQVMPAHD